jgi:hypothetical protein
VAAVAEAMMVMAMVVMLSDSIEVCPLQSTICIAAMMTDDTTHL